MRAAASPLARHRHGVVRREVVPVVLEHRQVVGVDQAARRVAGDQIHLPLGERAVDQRQVHRPRRRGEVQAVASARPGIAVGALQELVAEAGAASCAPAGAASSIVCSPSRRGIVAADEDRERVLEAERIEQRQPGLRRSAGGSRRARVRGSVSTG